LPDIRSMVGYIGCCIYILFCPATDISAEVRPIDVNDGRSVIRTGLLPFWWRYL